jgi:small-conductance mechanosensitive channel
LRALEGRLRPDFRRALVFGVVAFAALAVGHELMAAHPGWDAWRVAAYGLAAVVLVMGVLATRSASREVGRVAALRAPQSTAAPLRLLVQVVGYAFTVLAVLTVLEVDISQFLVGGALTGVVLGIAAQQALSNVFAGMVLQLARPYQVGSYVRVHSGAIGGPHEGTVADVSLMYTTLVTAEGQLLVPNGQLLGAAVVPSAVPLPAEPPEDGPTAGTTAEPSSRP